VQTYARLPSWILLIVILHAEIISCCPVSVMLSTLMKMSQTTAVLLRLENYRYTTLFRQTLFRQTLLQQSAVGTSDGWLQLNRPTGSTDWKYIEPNPENQGQYNCVGAWRYVVTFPEEGHPRPHRDTLRRPQSPRWPQCLDQCRAFDACEALTPSSFLQISTISTYA